MLAYIRSPQVFEYENACEPGPCLAGNHAMAAPLLVATCGSVRARQRPCKRRYSRGGAARTLDRDVESGLDRAIRTIVPTVGPRPRARATRSSFGHPLKRRK